MEPFACRYCGAAPVVLHSLNFLQSAVNNSNVEVVDFLLKFGADRDVREVKFR